MARNESIKSAFLAMHLHHLRKLITRQSDRLFADQGIRAPSSCVSVLMTLDDAGPGSIAYLADSLGYSHQLISQRLSKLEDLGFIEKRPDPADQRKSVVGLTDAGKEQAALINEVLPMAAAAFDQVFDALGVDLCDAATRAHALLTANPLTDRVGEFRSPPPAVPAAGRRMFVPRG